jgi:hypothetical protein
MRPLPSCAFLPLLFLPTTFLAGCGIETYAELTGSVEGHSFTPVAAYWGGPFLVLTNEELACMDMSWVNRTYVSGDEAPINKDLEAMQFTFNESDAVAGTYSVEGYAPVYGHFISINDGALDIWRAKTGSLVVDEITKQDVLIGTFNVGFDDGAMTGEFALEWCNNLKSKY